MRHFDILVTWQTKSVASPLSQGLWTLSLARCCLRWGDLTYKVKWHIDHVVMREIKTVISSLSQGLWIPNLAGWWLRIRGPHPQTHMTLQYRGHVTNKKSYTSTFTRPMNRKLSRLVIYLQIHATHRPRGHMTNQTRYISTLTSICTPDLARWCFRMREIHRQSYVTLQLCRHVTTQKYLVFTFKGSRSTNFAGWWLVWEDPTQHIMCHLGYAVTWQLSIIYSISTWTSLLKINRFQMIMRTLKMCNLYKGSS